MKNYIFLIAISLWFIAQDTYAQCNFNQVEASISLNLDNFGEETTWQIFRAADGALVSEGGPYPENDLQMVTEMVCLEQGCYDFYLFDSGGDGFCCEEGNGTYNISIPGQNLINGNGDFLNLSVQTFCIGLNLNGPACNLNFNVNTSPAACGFANGAMQIIAFGGLGNYQYRLGVGGWTNNNVLEGLAPGTYQVYTRNANGTCVTGPQNITITEDCATQPCANNLVTLNIDFDNNPEEIIWQLYANDTLVIFGDGLYDQGTNSVTRNFCLPDGCYTFVLFDSKQNGICCEAGQGSYSLMQNDVLLGGGNGQYTDGEVVAFCVGDNNPGFIPGVAFTANAFLQGALLNTPLPGLMRDDLRANGLLPLLEPYSALSNFDHVGDGGGETIPQAAIDFDNPQAAVVDWGFLELRNAQNPTEVVATQSVLLLKNGLIIGTSEQNTDLIVFPNVPSGFYYVALRHRNHLGVMTGQPVGLGRISVNINLASTQTPFWGNNPLIDMGNGQMALWAGNCNQNGDIIFQGGGNDPDNIFFDVLSAPLNTGFQANYINSEYSSNDVNLDGDIIFQGNNNDPNVIFFNALGHPGNNNFSANYIIQEQVP